MSKQSSQPSAFEWRSRPSALAPELAAGGKRSADASGVIERKRKVDPTYQAGKTVGSRKQRAG